MQNSCARLTSQLTAEAAVQLLDGIDLVLKRWTALQMAVENESGGPATRQEYEQLPFRILSAFTQSKEKVYIDDIEEILRQFMDSLLTIVQDDSIPEVALKIMYLHEDCLEGNFNSIKELRETNIGRRPATYSRQGASDHDDSSSNMAIESMETESSSCQDMVVDESVTKLQAEVDENGWTKVVTRRNKGNKKLKHNLL